MPITSSRSAESDVFRCLVLFHQQLKVKVQFTIENKYKKKKEYICIWEAETKIVAD